MKRRYGKLKKIMAVVLALTMSVGSLTLPSVPASAKFLTETASAARQVAAEGIVMLQNDDNTLPFNAGNVVSIFGRCQVNSFACGYGSGSAPSGAYSTVTIMQGIKKNPTIKYNEELAEIYEDWCAENPPSGGSWGNWPYYHPEMPVTEEMVAEAREVSDIAMVVIGRAAGEDRECKLQEGSYYLTSDEKALLSKINAQFEKIVILLNVGNVIDMSWIEDYSNIKSVLYVWQGGVEMGNGIADVLSGDVSPSGKLSSTLAKTYTDYPTSDTFASNDGNTAKEVYYEDIYVGYRYFETFAKDRVLYPFGYGMSYTTFDTEATMTSDAENITVTATVTNTGSVYSGKEVVQVYYEAPQGELGKPSRTLGGYVKTNEIAPGASQTVEITIQVDNMASYDDSGVTGHDSAWVLEAGDYNIYVGNSVRAAEMTGTWTLDNLKVVEQLEEASAPHESFDRLVPVVDENGNITEGTEEVPTATEEADLATRVLANLPEAIEQTEDQGIKLIDVYNGTNTMDEFIAQLTVEELAAITRGDWGQGSQLTVRTSNVGSYAGMLESLREKGIPAISTHDGPSGPKYGQTATNLPIGTMLACTWNDELVEKLYYGSGSEMVDSSADVLLAPGMNIHRDPLCGRNFEYFSEDPLLTGQMGAAATRGLQEAGVSSTPKHYAVNSQETNRHNSDSVVSERAQREIYLRGFEICVKSAKPYNLMASYNKINGEWSHYNYDTATTILRDDWGYEGVLMTDWWLRQDTSEELGVSNNAYRIRAQVDVNMPGEGPHYENGSLARTDTATIAAYQEWVDAGSTTDELVGLTLGELQRSARTVLNFAMESRVFRATYGLANTYEAGPDWFSVSGVSEEVKPQLDSLTIEGMDFVAFDPATLVYEVFWSDMTAEFPEVYATAADAQITIVQATEEVPAATITVNKDGGKSIYRVIFTDEAGLEPVVKNPTLAKVTGISIDGEYIREFYPTIYSYSVTANIETAEILVDVPAGVTSTITKDMEKYTVTIRAESKDQAVEYELKFPKPDLKSPQSDNFDDGSLDTEIWQVLRQTSSLTEADGTLNIQTEGGEWYGTGSDKNNMNNVVYQEAGGNWTATVKLIIPNPSALKSKDTNQFGIAVFDDADNYADMNYVTASWSSAGHFLQVRQETAGTCKDTISNSNYGTIKSLPTTEDWASKDEVTLWMRVKKSGTEYTFSVKTDTMEANGEDFATLGIVTDEFQVPKIGLYASKGNGSAASSLIQFDDFEVNVDDGRPQSDPFDGTSLQSFWSVDTLNSNLTVADGSLNIQTESGEWYGSNEDSWPISNMPYQSAKGNWTATVEMVIPSPGDLRNLDTNQFGITIFDDSDNYVDMNYISASWLNNDTYDGQRLQVRQEKDGVCKDSVASANTAFYMIPATENWDEKDSVTLWLRVKKEGADYTFYVLTDTMKEAGEDYMYVVDTTAYFDSPKLGLYATLGKTANSCLVKFNDLTISDYVAAPEEEEPLNDPVTVSKAGESKVMAVNDAVYLTSTLKAESCSDSETPGGQDLGYGVSGQYAMYVIQVEDAGYYKMSTRVASGVSNELAQLSHDVEMDGEVIASYRHTATGGWQAWIDTDAQTLYFPEGRHVLRFVYGSQINFNFIRLVPCTDEEANAQAVINAKAVVEDLTARQMTVDQETANTEETVKSWLAAQIQELFDAKESLSSVGAQITADDITILADTFQAAEAGTNGSYSFTAALTLGESSVTSEVRSGVIKAAAVETETPDTTQEKAGLQALYDAWAEENLSGYTTESAAALTAALTAAKEVLDDEDASLQDVIGATSDLIAAIGGLETEVQKLHLQTAVDSAEEIIAETTNADTVAELAAAVAAGKAVLESETATQTKVDEATNAILDAMAALSVEGNMAILEELIAAAENLSSDRYTSDSRAALDEAIAAAKEVVAEGGDNDAINEAYAALIDAVIGLVARGNKAALNAVIAKADTIMAAESSYVTATLDGLAEALASAKEVQADEDALQPAIDAKVRALTIELAEVRLLGDVNNDGVVTTSDSAAVLRAAAEYTTLSADDAASADVNRDGEATTADAVLILQYSAEMISEF